ncbi:MAG: PRTRC system protein C [Bacteroidetes bacterium]|nr:PRTRC system protein C [Bacteroidota bacterium]
MLVTSRLQRVFLFEDRQETIRLADPSSTFTPEAVQNFYAQTYPVLTTAKIEGPDIRNDEIQYRFISTIGTKG